MNIPEDLKNTPGEYYWRKDRCKELLLQALEILHELQIHDSWGYGREIEVLEKRLEAARYTGD